VVINLSRSSLLGDLGDLGVFGDLIGDRVGDLIGSFESAGCFLDPASASVLSKESLLPRRDREVGVGG
jgi:hypothetical protein